MSKVLASRLRKDAQHSLAAAFQGLLSCATQLIFRGCSVFFLRRTELKMRTQPWEKKIIWYFPCSLLGPVRPFELPYHVPSPVGSIQNVDWIQENICKVSCAQSK